MSFSTLPNELLDMILNQKGIPLLERMRIRAVSPRFRATIEDGLQQEDSLTVRVMSANSLKKRAKRSSADETKPKANVLIIKASNFKKNKAISLIHRIYPRLSKLSFYSDTLGAWENSGTFLRHYIPTLSSLKVNGEDKLYRSCKKSRCQSVFGSLCQGINSLSNLTSLYLKKRRINPYLLPHLGATLPRLEGFSVQLPVSWYNAAFMAKSLSSRCTHLRLDCEFVQLDNTSVGHLAPSLTHLHLTNTDGMHLGFVSQLTGLTNLTLVPKDCLNINLPNLNALFPAIQPLSRLTQLSIGGIYYDRPLAAPPSKASTFPSVKHLALQFNYIYDATSFSDGHFLSTLASWFPSLSTCSLSFSPPNDNIGEMEAHLQGGHPFTVQLLDFEEWSRLGKSFFKSTFE